MMHKIKIIFSWLLIGVLFLGALEPGSDAFAAKKNKYIRMNVKSVTLSKNGMYKLRLYNTKKRQTIVFSSDNESIATVTSTTQPKLAVVTAVNPGNTYVRATISNSRGRVVRTLKVKVKVTPYAVSVKFGKKKIYLNETKNTKLNTIIKPNISQEIPLYESDTDVATVNSRGIVTAVAAGEAVITATLLSSGQSASCTVVVKPEPVETVPPEATSTTSAAKNIRSN